MSGFVGWGPRRDKKRRKPAEYKWSPSCAIHCRCDVTIACPSCHPACPATSPRCFLMCYFYMYRYFALLFFHWGSLQTECCTHAHLFLSPVTTGSAPTVFADHVSSLKCLFLPLEMVPILENRFTFIVLFYVMCVLPACVLMQLV